MRCMNKIVTQNFKARCYLDHGHDGVCRNFNGKPFTPTKQYADVIADRMEHTLLDEKPKPVVAAPSVFQNDTLSLKLRKALTRT